MIRIRTTDEIVIHDGLDVTMADGKITISRADEGTSVQAYKTSLQAQVDAQKLQMFPHNPQGYGQQ